MRHQKGSPRCPIPRPAVRQTLAAPAAPAPLRTHQELKLPPRQQPTVARDLTPRAPIAQQVATTATVALRAVAAPVGARAAADPAEAVVRGGAAGPVADATATARLEPGPTPLRAETTRRPRTRVAVDPMQAASKAATPDQRRHLVPTPGQMASRLPVLLPANPRSAIPVRHRHRHRLLIRPPAGVPARAAHQDHLLPVTESPGAGAVVGAVADADGVDRAVQVAAGERVDPTPR